MCCLSTQVLVTNAVWSTGQSLLTVVRAEIRTEIENMCVGTAWQCQHCSIFMYLIMDWMFKKLQCRRYSSKCEKHLPRPQAQSPVRRQPQGLRPLPFATQHWPGVFETNLTLGFAPFMRDWKIERCREPALLCGSQSQSQRLWPAPRWIWAQDRRGSLV